MSELDVREVKLQLRYPESRQEDITDAYMRGCLSAVQVTDKLITRLNEENEKLKAENAKLRQQLADVTESMGRVEERCAKLRELVHGLNHCITWASEDGKDCWSCPLWHDKDCIAEDIERELGIEDNT